MISLVTAECALKWLDASGSETETRMHSLSSRSVATIAGALQSYRAVALGISDCVVIAQEITYAEVPSYMDIVLPVSGSTSAESLVLIFATTNPLIYFPVVCPSPKSVLFTADIIPTIDIAHSAIVALANAIIGYYCTPDGYIATELIAAVYSREF